MAECKLKATLGTWELTEIKATKPELLVVKYQA